MNSIALHLDGADPIKKRIAGARVIHVADAAIDMALLKAGTVAGRHSIAIAIPLPDGQVLLFETTAALFVNAASAFQARIEMDKAGN